MHKQRRNLFALAEGITHRRAVTYARFSSEMQRDGWTIQAQVRTLDDYLQAKGIPIVATCTDEAKSAKTLVRDGLQDALGYIRDGKANMLAVCKLDRATREAFDAFGLERELRALGASLFCIEENLDTADPNARMMFGIHAVMAQHYRENLARETAKGKRARVQQKLANGDVHYGYRRPLPSDVRDFPGDADALRAHLRRLPDLVVPERAQAVHLAFELYASGLHSYASVARELNQRGYQMVSKFQPEGGPFKKDTITEMLKDPYYCGRVSYAGLKTHGQLDLHLRRRHGKAEIGHGIHEPIISDDLFERVAQIRREKAQAGAPRPAAEGRVYIAAGLPHCLVCKQPLRAHPGRSGPRYVDRSIERGIPCDAGSRSIPMDLVDQVISEDITSWVLSDAYVSSALDRHGKVPEPHRHVEQRIALERKLARLKVLVKEGIIDLDEYRHDVAGIEDELAALERTVVVPVTREAMAERLRDLPTLWRLATPEGRAEITHELFAAVWCNLTTRRVHALELTPEWKTLKSLLTRDESMTTLECTLERTRRASTRRQGAVFLI